MEPKSNTEQRIAELIIQSLNLDGITPEEIEPEAALFGDGLGLDSIDGLEIAMAVSKAFGVELRSDHPDNREIFASLRSLAAYVDVNRSA
jgi:acyl carrier protein